MKTVKRVSTDYDIYAGTVTINGNLVVVGTSTQVESVNALIYDNFVTLAAGQTGGPTLDAGIEIERGDQPTVSVRWHEATQHWEYTDDGVIFKRFGLQAVVEDPDPHLGGNLFVNDFSITSEAGHDVVIVAGEGGELILGPAISLPNQITDIGPKVDHSTIYAKEPAAGDTGFYVSNSKVSGRELITNRKAFLYSIIF